MSAMPDYVVDALAIAREVDPGAESMGEGAWDCLLVAEDSAEWVMRDLGPLFDYEDPNEAAARLGHTRILVKPREGR